MKIERTIKVALEAEEHHAVNAVLDIVSKVLDKLDNDEVFVVDEEQYNRDRLEQIHCFLADLWQNGGCACEIKKG